MNLDTQIYVDTREKMVNVYNRAWRCGIEKVSTEVWSEIDKNLISKVSLITEVQAYSKISVTLYQLHKNRK